METENMHLRSIITEKDFEISQLQLKLEQSEAQILNQEAENQQTSEESKNDESISLKIYNSLKAQYEKLLEQFEFYRNGYDEQKKSIHNLH